MRTIYVLLLSSLLLCSVSLADPPNPVWTRTFGGDGDQRANALCRTTDGAVVFAGTGVSNNGMGMQAVIMKVSVDGDSLWSYRYPSNPGQYDSAEAYAVAPTFDGGVVVGGSKGLLSSRYPFMIKLSADGDSVWALSYSSWSYTRLFGVTEAADTAIVAVGYSGLATQNLFALRTARTGGIRFNRTLGSGGVSYARGVLALPDNGVMVCGRLEVDQPGAALMRMSTRLDTLWTKRYDLGHAAGLNAIQRTTNGGFILAGTWSDVNATDAYAVRTDSSGMVTWSRHFGGAQIDSATAVLALANGSFIVGGLTSNAQGYTDGMASQLDPSGTVEWTATSGGAGNDAITALAPAPDCGFFAAGYTQLIANGATQIMLLRYPPGSGITGMMRDSITNQPVPNVHVRVIGRTDSAMSEANGHYTLYVVPGTYDVIVSGPCVARDTLRNVVVLPDSLGAVDWRVRLPHGGVYETSLSPVVHNHIPSTTLLYVHNDGPGVLDFSVRSETRIPNSPWLGCSPNHGSVAPMDSLAVGITISADTSGSGIFDYLGYVYVKANSCPDTLQTIALSPTVLRVDGKTSMLPERFDFSAYPNPFNPLTMLTLSLPLRSHVQLSLYDVSGQTVKTLCNGILEAGVQRITVDASDLPSGIYFVRMQTPAFTRTQKLVLLK